MTTNTTKKDPGAFYSKCLHNDNSGTVFLAGDAARQFPYGKATQIGCLVLAGHAVHQPANGGFLLFKYSYTHHAQDFAALHDFFSTLGVTQ